MSVVILDYGLGNLKSLFWALERIGCHPTVSSDINIILKAEKLIIPGVGSFGEARKNLDQLRLPDFLKDYAADMSKKVLGICLGMQLLFDGSEESPGVPGLSLLEGTFKRFDDKLSHVPHMGWNNLEPVTEGVNLKYLSNVGARPDFYFVHSYGLFDAKFKNHARTLHGSKLFTSYIEHENITCAQFHPEKSHMAGLTLLKNWVNA